MGLDAHKRLDAYIRLALTLYAELMARRLHCPSTVLLVTGWIPLIPGGSLYYSISALVSGHMEEFTDRTLHTILLMIVMSAGVLLAMTIVRIVSFFQKGAKPQKAGDRP